MKISFKNPYKFKFHWFIFCYLFFEKKKNIWQKLFNELAFILVKKKINFFTVGYYNKNIFKLRVINSQFSSIFSFSKTFYEPEVYATIIDKLPIGGVFVDVGSNWGHHSIIASKEKNATIYAFEANPSSAQDLKDICDDLKLKNFYIYNCALGKNKKKTQITQFSYKSGFASTSAKFIQKYYNPNNFSFFKKLFKQEPIKINVNQNKLDNILAHTKVDLIKVDIEGSELNCLLGAKKILKANNCTVIFEIHTNNKENFIKFKNFFNSLGYEMYIITVDIKLGRVFYTKFNNLLPNTQYNLLASKKIFKRFSLK